MSSVASYQSCSSSTRTGLCPTAAGLVRASPPEETRPLFTRFTWLSAAFLITGNKILPGAICSTPVILTACLPRVSEIWSRQCFHNPTRARTLEGWGSFSEPWLALWGHSMPGPILLPRGDMGFLGSQGKYSTMGNIAFAPRTGCLDPKRCFRSL